jgi:hypothetical protein
MATLAVWNINPCPRSNMLRRHCGRLKRRFGRSGASEIISDPMGTLAGFENSVAVPDFKGRSAYLNPPFLSKKIRRKGHSLAFVPLI